MQYTNLPDMQKRVSRLCFGTLTISPLQRGFSLQAGLSLLRYAADAGVNFFDTAELYETYAPLRELLRFHPDAVIATKCYAYDEATAQKSYQNAVRQLGREYIDIFLLHEQESEHTLRGHQAALQYFYKLKQAGYIGLTGLSTHHVAAVRASVKHPLVEIIHPLINMTGVGIADGTCDQMLESIHSAYASGKSVYAMKPLGGGHLYADAEQAMDYMWNLRCVHAVAQGFQSTAEIDFALRVLDKQPIPETLRLQVAKQPRRLMIHDWCVGCGKCVQACSTGAIEVQAGRARVDESRCVLCGYCAPKCPDFCIKVV